MFHKSFHIFSPYSVLSASAESSIDAILAGIDPPITANVTLTNIIAWIRFNCAIFGNSDEFSIT